MRSFLVFAAVLGLAGVYLWQKHSEQQTSEANRAPATTHSAAAQPSVSEHDWMKRSLDRATEVRNTARRQTEEAQDP
jgi:cytoskeletal protein RodZ